MKAFFFAVVLGMLTGSGPAEALYPGGQKCPEGRTWSVTQEDCISNSGDFDLEPAPHGRSE